MGLSITQVLGRVFSSSDDALRVIARLGGLPGGGKITHVALDDTQWTALPTTALVNRANIFVQNISGNGGVVLWNYSASAPGTEGIRIEDTGGKTADLSPGIAVYGRMLSGMGTVVVDEVS